MWANTLDVFRPHSPENQKTLWLLWLRRDYLFAEVSDVNLVILSIFGPRAFASRAGLYLSHSGVVSLSLSETQPPTPHLSSTATCRSMQCYSWGDRVMQLGLDADKRPCFLQGQTPLDLAQVKRGSWIAKKILEVREERGLGGHGSFFDRLAGDKVCLCFPLFVRRVGVAMNFQAEVFSSKCIETSTTLSSQRGNIAWTPIRAGECECVINLICFVSDCEEKSDAFLPFLRTVCYWVYVKSQSAVVCQSRPLLFIGGLLEIFEQVSLSLKKQTNKQTNTKTNKKHSKLIDQKKTSILWPRRKTVKVFECNKIMIVTFSGISSTTPSQLWHQLRSTLPQSSGCTWRGSLSTGLVSLWCCHLPFMRIISEVGRFARNCPQEKIFLTADQLSNLYTSRYRSSSTLCFWCIIFTSPGEQILDS